MSAIFTSATKIVLLILTFALVAGLFLGKITNENFMQIVTSVVAFYFGQKSATSTNSTTDINATNVTVPPVDNSSKILG